MHCLSGSVGFICQTALVCLLLQQTNGDIFGGEFLRGNLLPFRKRVDLKNNAVETICIPGRAPVGSTMFSKIHVCENGYMSFDKPVCNHFTSELGRDFPYHSPNMIAPFWADIDTGIRSSANNTVFVDSISHSSSEPLDQSILGHINNEIRAYSNDTTFEATHIVLATWHEVLRWNLRQMGARDESASFQAVYVTNGKQSFAIIVYKDEGMMWRDGRVLAGFKYGYIPHQMSLRMANANQNCVPYAFDKVLGNRGLPGYWIKQVNSGAVNNPESKDCSFYCCDAALCTPVVPTTKPMTEPTTTGTPETTMIQRRFDGSVNFYRGWQEYKDGFGNPSGEFWLGLDAIHNLTKSGDRTLRFDLWDDREHRFAEYKNATVATEAHNYRLHYASYTGTAGDAMAYHSKGLRFSTYDQDNDLWGGNCAVRYKGAWWYESCHHANLNGLYLNGSNTQYGVGMTWRQFRGLYYSLLRTEIKIQRM